MVEAARQSSDMRNPSEEQKKRLVLTEPDTLLCQAGLTSRSPTFCELAAASCAISKEGGLESLRVSTAVFRVRKHHAKSHAKPKWQEP